MSVKEEIKHRIDQLPESILCDLLDYLKKVENSKEIHLQYSEDLPKILEEDKEFVKRTGEMIAKEDVIQIHEMT